MTVYLDQAAANALFSLQDICINLFLCFLTLALSYYLKDYQVWQLSSSSGFYTPKTILLALRSKPILLLWVVTVAFNALWSTLAASIWKNQTYLQVLSEPQVIQIVGSYAQGNVITLPPYQIPDAVAYGYNITCSAFGTCYNSTEGLQGVYPEQDMKNLTTGTMEVLSRPDPGWVTDFNMSEVINLSVGGIRNPIPCSPGRQFCTAFNSSAEGTNMVLANDLRLDVNMVKFSEASGVHPLAGSINWPNIYETFTTGEIRTTYAATGVYFAGVNNSVVLSDLVVYIEQNSTARVWSGNLSTILQNFNFSTTLCEGEPLCAINMAEITGSARLARVSIVNDEFRLESINVYMSYPHTTTVASVNMSITGYSTKLGDVYNSTNVPKTWKNSLVFSNTSTGDKRQDTKILKQGQIDTVFYTSYGWNGATVSRYKRKGNGVQINASMIVITVLAAVVAISAWLMQRIDGLSAFGPPLALSIAGLVEQDTASDNSPDSDKDVQLRRSSSSSRLFLTVNGKPLMTAEVALNEGLSLMNKIEMERKTTTIDVILP